MSLWFQFFVSSTGKNQALIPKMVKKPLIYLLIARELNLESSGLSFVALTVPFSWSTFAPSHIVITLTTFFRIFYYNPYLTDGIPQDVTSEWNLWSDRIQKVPTTAIDPAGPFPSYKTLREALFSKVPREKIQKAVDIFNEREAELKKMDL